MRTRIIFTAIAALLAFSATMPARALYIPNCPQLCTPNCPCSIECLGIFGPTTCGEAGEACNGLVDTNDSLSSGSMTPSNAEADEVFLLELQAEAEAIGAESSSAE